MDLLEVIYNRPDLKRHAKPFIMDSWLKPMCWTCLKPFNNSRLRNDHHIIPSAFGGRDGPQVSLCSDHHALLHKVADLLVVADKRTVTPEIQAFLMGLTEEEVSRTMFLASRAAHAERTFRNDPNRGVLISTTVPNTLLLEIKQAAKILDLTVADLTTEALTEYIRRRFPVKV